MSYFEVDRKLRRNGWYVVRSAGSHFQYRHDGCDYVVTVPNHGSKDLGKGILGKISRVSGISFH